MRVWRPLACAVEALRSVFNRMYDLGLTHSPMFTYPAETGRSFCPYTQLKTDLKSCQLVYCQMEATGQDSLIFCRRDI